MPDNQIYKDKKNGPINWFHKDPKKSNQWCLYCARFVGSESPVPSNKEHLIGRNFVPRGSMENNFNFIFRACTECNTEKAEYERHISSGTLINSSAREDQKINEIAIRKAQDSYPGGNGKKVIDSGKELKISLKGKNGFSMKFSFSSGPEISREYVKNLAFYHVQALFSLITSKDPLSKEDTRLLPIENINFFDSFSEKDWGNPQLIELAERTVNWHSPLDIITANGHFKAILKRSSFDDGWFWALEWNKHLRVVGGISIPVNKHQKIFQSLPAPHWKGLNPTTRFYEETPLGHNPDKLFLSEIS